jgi:hypothetical protein
MKSSIGFTIKSTHMKKLNKWLKILIVGVPAAIIGGLFSIYASNDSHSTLAVEQKNTNGPNTKVTDSHNNTQSNSGSGSSTMDVDQSSNNCYNCYNTTYNTTNVYLPKNTVRSAAQGDTFYVDAAKKMIHFRPRSGEWANPFVGVPTSETDSVSPQLYSATRSISADNAIDTLAGQVVHVLSTTSVGASPKSEILLQYDKLPNVIYFGDLKGPIFKATRGEQLAYSKK